ncbi:NAD-dependent epimerase/dehydratase family protein [Actinophytocola algeriensis]|uniref:Nucleoside-diphosphate-sugar epimerase n=1 Tax=Actinophytocola algeriensis TaxID=1768010 RepID=A0A7W7Q823_9PSEU|nr:NAD-dependent epimerase/dehydratase family protein [Actinophytocola algeriensis]MBB4908796.1 nucleoside-diphosphate-sugar epimerase [Actinophytocola algeriensis]MBE1474817.1 nucleoside-diphosphate-sugar epimerase [Actinophytocola algeriensis]
MHVFVTGAGGYIGGTVASRLVRAGHTVTGLTRDVATAADVARLGIQPVVGTLDDAAVLTEHACRADAVVNAADSDHRDAVETLIAALAGSDKPLIHTSGSSIVGTGTEGEISEAIFYEDILDPDSTWEPDHPLRKGRVAIDRLVLTAADKGIRTAVLCHSLIYGHGRGPGHDSVLIAALVRQARSGGVVRHVGAGRNVWSTVHLDDVADLYLLALEKSPPGTFYFVENGEESFAAMTVALARSLGLPGPQPWHPDSPDNIWNHQFALHALGSNSRVRGAAARELLGWRPRHHSIIDWITNTDLSGAVGRQPE